VRLHGLAPAAVALVVLALACPAWGSPQFTSTYKLKLSTKKPASSAGWTADVKFRDPGDPMQRPKILTSIRFNLPRGSKFDTKAHAACTATDQQLIDSGPGAVCPAASRYGSGRASVIVGTAPLSFPINSYNLIPVDFNNRKPQLLLDVVLDPTNPALSFIIDGTLGSHSISFSLDQAPMFDIHTTDIHFVLPPATKGKRRYLRTPKTCPRKGSWKASVRATFSDGSAENKPLKLPCRRR
jgi:hypothetical protein